MVGDLLLVVFGFLLGVGATRLVSRRRRISQQVQSSVTALGEELQALTFDPAGPEATPPTLNDYRLALDAYDRAASAKNRATAVAALRDGRAALIRLDARRAGRPVPIDALPTSQPGADGSGSRVDPETGTGERFVTTGKGGGTVEVLIDRPEPGRCAVVELAATGRGKFEVTPVIRTEGETRTLGRVECAWHAYRGRHLLPPEGTHLRIETAWERSRWSVRIRPISAASPLDSEWHGTGNDVLSYQGGPALLTVQITSVSSWSVQFVCGCPDGFDCRCKEPDWPAGTPGDSLSLSGRQDGRRTLRLPRPGYLVVEGRDAMMDYPDGTWYLSVQPVSGLPGKDKEARRSAP